ncbi:MAG: hypothetical protein AB1498_07590 [bacterium]
MNFCRGKNKALIILCIFSIILSVNFAYAQNDTAQMPLKDTPGPVETETAFVTGDIQKQQEWYNFEKYNLVGNWTYSLTNIKMNDNLKEVGKDYAGLNHKLSYLLMGTSSGWDVSNLADLFYNPWRDRLIAETFRLEAAKGGTNINIGDFYPSYSSITLEGLTIRGLGFKRVYYNERLLVQAFIAQSQKAVEPVKEDKNGNSVIDQGEDGNGNNILDVKEGDFRQHMMGGRIENKFSRNFSAGANYLAGRDDISSITNPQSADPVSGLYPVLNNKVIGLDGHFHFFDDRLKVDSEYGESNYRKGDKDTTFTDQAVNAKINFLSKWLQSRIIYQKVDPNYHSEGNPYLETDKKGYNFENELILSKKYSLSGNYEKYNNNVNKLPVDTTIVTKEQEFKLRYYPESGSREFKYKKTAKNGTRANEKDTIDDTYGITIRKDYSEETWVTYNLQYIKYKDNLQNTNDYTGYSAYLSWNWDIKKDKFSLIPYFNYNLYKYKNLDQKQIYYLTNIQSRIVLWKNKWVLVPYLEYDYTSQNGSKILERFSRDLESKFYLSQSVSFSLKYGILNNNDENNNLDYSMEKVGGEITAVF